MLVLLYFEKLYLIWMPGLMKIVLLEQTGTNKGNLYCSVIWNIWIQFFRSWLRKYSLCFFQSILVSQCCSELKCTSCHYHGLIGWNQSAWIDMKIGYIELNSSLSDFQETSPLVSLWWIGNFWTVFGLAVMLARLMYTNVWNMISIEYFRGNPIFVLNTYSVHIWIFMLIG